MRELNARHTVPDDADFVARHVAAIRGSPASNSRRQEGSSGLRLTWMHTFRCSRGCTRSGSKDIEPSGTNWKASPRTTRVCRLRQGSLTDIKRRKATVDDFVAA